MVPRKREVLLSIYCVEKEEDNSRVTASCRITNERYTSDSKSLYIFYRDTQFLPIFFYYPTKCLLFEKQKFFKKRCTT